MSKLDGVDPEEIRRLYWDENRSLDKLAKRYDLGRELIRQFMVANNIPRREEKKKSIVKLNPEDIRKLYHDDLLSTVEIGKLKNVSHGIICQFMKDNNIPRRSFSESSTLSGLRKTDKKEIKMSEQATIEIAELNPSIKEEHPLLLPPTTTRGKTELALEIKRETELELPSKKINDYKDKLKSEYESLDREFTRISDQIQQLEQSNRNSVLPPVRRKINKSKMVTLELEQEDIASQRTEKLNLINEINYNESILENVMAFKEMASRVDEAEKMITELKRISVDLNRVSNSILTKIMTHYGL